MLWHDLRDDPAESARALRARLRRAGWLIAATMVLASLLLLA
ncbi:MULTISPECIES: morphogenic membrane protein MmpB [Streptomyces]|nr:MULTISPECIES: hypothetical protein [Streptomyces]